MLNLAKSVLFADTQTFLIFAVVLLVGLYFFKGCRKYPPGPLALPLLGSTLWFRRLVEQKKRISRAVYADTKRYGSNVIRVKAGSRDMVFVQGYDLIHELFVKQAALYSGRPPYLPSSNRFMQEGRGIIWESGHPWKVLRKFTFHSLREFGLGKTSMEQKVFEEIEAATAVIKKKAGEPVNIRELSSMMILNVIYRIVFGKRFDYKDTEFHEIIENLHGLFKFSSNLVADPSPNFIKKLIIPQVQKEYEERAKISEWIRQHVYTQIEHHEATFESENIRDFIDLYIREKKSEENKEFYTGMHNTEEEDFSFIFKPLIVY